MNVVFLGTGPFAVPVLEALQRASSRHPLAAVVTRPDRRGGRGRRALEPSPVKRRAGELGVAPCVAPETVNAVSFLDELRSLEPDLIVAADYGEILRRPFLEAPRIGAFNLHASLLPKYRGAAPVAYTILAGETTTGVTLFRIEERLDAGPIVAQKALEIGEDETSGELERRLAGLGAELIAETLDHFAAGSFTETPQDDAEATFAPKLRPEMALIDWGDDPEAIRNKVRAFRPWPVAYTYVVAERGGRARKERTRILRGSADPRVEPGRPPGTIVEVTKKDFRVACGGGSLRILELQREGKSALAASEYLRGHPLEPGDRLVSQ